MLRKSYQVNESLRLNKGIERRVQGNAKTSNKNYL